MPAARLGPLQAFWHHHRMARFAPPAPQRAAEAQADADSAQALGPGLRPGWRASPDAPLFAPDAAVRDVLARRGQHLPGPLCTEMESRFGHSFAQVRVHADASAARAAAAWGARAFTVGHHIGFAAGAFVPTAPAGRALLAHELVHVLQQTSPGGRAGLAFKLEPAPGATAVPVAATPVRGEGGDKRVAAAIQLLTRCRDQVTASPSLAASMQKYVLGAIRLFEQHVLGSRMTPAFAANADARDDARRCEAALGALRFLETGFRVAVPDLGDRRSWDSAIGALTLARRPLAQLLNYLSPKERYQAMVTDAQTHGMPVKMVGSVAKTSGVSQAGPTDDERYEPRANTVYLKARSLTQGLPANDPSQADSIAALYHESTHAFLVKHRDVEPYKSALDAAVAHYTGAPVGSEDEPTGDPYRVVQEAAAEYVEARVMAWWYAFGTLNHYASRGVLGEEQLRQIRDNYEAAQKRTTYGYDETLFSQRPTSRPMSRDLLTLVNDDLLEGKIAVPFDSVPQFKAIIDKARAHKQLP